MTNLEFYKDEIKAQYNYNINNSLGTSSLEDFAAAINHISRQHKQGLATCIDILNWLCEEYKMPILTHSEYEYLNNLITPFKHRVCCICKKSHGDYEELYIKYDNNTIFTLPDFEEDMMFQGMEANKEYAPEELGL